ncbi:MAG: hypothetical protein ACLRMZ_10665 [Blautia marasmi]
MEPKMHRHLQKRCRQRRTHLRRIGADHEKYYKTKTGCICFLFAASFLLYSFVVFVPIILADITDALNGGGGPNKKFIGWKIIYSFSVTRVFRALGNNIYLVVVCVLGQLVLHSF